MTEIMAAWLKTKRESKSFFWRKAFLIIDSLQKTFENHENSRHLEKAMNMPVKALLKKIQKETLRSRYFGIPAIKSPMDFWIYMEIVNEIKPDIIIEIGNAWGGMLLAFAHMLDHIGNGRVIGVDIDHSKIPLVVKAHHRISLLEGDACGSFVRVKDLILPHHRVLIIEDSSHTYENTLNILRTYNSLVSKGSYFIIEDSIINHGLIFRNGFHSGGPHEAIEAFIKENNDFVIDRTMERFLITWNPKGYLRKIG
ncbi:MAG: CmcI family methyltransferase [Candidatus Omnitrophota bacterium]